jgi:RNA polymerase sigma-70 factor (ECF subfamily)
MVHSSSKNRINPSEWVDNYGDYLYTYAYYRVSSSEKAEDIVQETFLSALKAKDNFKGESSEKTWLVSILKRKIVDHYRKQSRSRESSSDQYDLPFIREGEDKGQWDPHRRPADWESEGIMNLEREEFYKILELCLSLLPGKWESVFRLKTLEELSSTKICKELGITASNLWVILHRARLRLRECFEEKYEQ